MFRLALVATFSLTLAHFGWEVYLEDDSPDYVVGGRIPALRAPTRGSHLYLRHTFHAVQRPRFGWLQVVGRSRVTVYVNGQIAADRTLDGFPVAAVIDICPLLQRGKNVIALATEQSGVGQPGIGLSSLDPPPTVAVTGMYENGGAEHAIDAESAWRCQDLFERSAHWWFEVDFDDRHWMEPKVRPVDMRACVDIPPRSVSERPAGKWIMPSGSIEAGEAVFLRQFDVPDSPHSAWLRLTTTNAYTLAVNGVVADVRDDPLGTAKPGPAIQRIYDVTRLIQPGGNVVTIAAISNSAPPKILTDFEVAFETRPALRLDSGKDWLARTGVPPRWYLDSSYESHQWQQCIEEAGDLGVPPWAPKRDFGQLRLPAGFAMQGIAKQLGLAVLIALVTVAACNAACRFIVADIGTLRHASLVYFCLSLPTLFLLVLLLAVYDPRVPRQAVYRELWVVVAALTVPLQWIVLACWRPTNGVLHPATTSDWRCSPQSLVAIGVLITIVGFWARWREIDVKPLQHDEASAYRSTQGLFERGFPSREIHPDMPPKLVETSELVYFCTALAALFFDQDLYVVRVPAILWGTVAIYLLFTVGWHMFSPGVGITAASLYAVAPICVQMACFGRYFSQLQFFATLAVYCFWRAVRCHGPVNSRALWCTAASFLAMYFTWQGAALLAPGLALAGLVYCRGRLAMVLTDRRVWSAVAVVLAVITLHMSCRSLHLSQFLAYGVGISGLSLTGMWQFPDFDLTYYLWQSSWNRDAFLPLLGITGAMLIAARHPFARPTRLILTVLLTTCLVKALLLPVYTWRYSFHLTPLVILLGATTAVACTRSFMIHVGRGAPQVWKVHARVVGTCVVTLIVGVGSGTTLQLTELSAFRIHSYDLPDLKFADLTDAMRFLRARLQPGDIIIASNPHVVDHFMESRACDYWLQSRFYTQAVLDDFRSTPLERIAGTPMISSREELEDLFSRHDRIWYVMIPSRHASQNTAEVTSFIRQHMEVAYEDYRALVLLRGDGSYPASQRLRGEQILLDADISPLPDS